MKARPGDRADQGRRPRRCGGGRRDVEILTNQTPFYGESGGQMGDAGSASNEGLRGAIEDTSKPLGRLHAHKATIESGEIKVGDAIHLSVDVDAAPQLAPTIRPRTCCTRRCATGSAAMSRRRAAWSRPIGCASISRTPSR
jgi:hypothetical protein